MVVVHSDFRKSLKHIHLSTSEGGPNSVLMRGTSPRRIVTLQRINRNCGSIPAGYQCRFRSIRNLQPHGSAFIFKSTDFVSPSPIVTLMAFDRSRSTYSGS